MNTDNGGTFMILTDSLYKMCSHICIIEIMFRVRYEYFTNDAPYTIYILALV